MDEVVKHSLNILFMKQFPTDKNNKIVFTQPRPIADVSFNASEAQSFPKRLSLCKFQNIAARDWH